MLFNKANKSEKKSLKPKDGSFNYENTNKKAKNNQFNKYIKEIEELKKKNETLKKENTKLLKLIDISHELNSSLDKKKVLNTLLGFIAELMNAVAISIFLADKKKSELTMEASNDIDLSNPNNAIKVPFGKGICGYVYQHNETVNIEDATKDSRFFSEADKKTGFKTKSIIAVPIIWENEVIGVAQCINKTDGGSFSKNDEKTFKKLLGQASTAIGNAKLYSQVLEKQKRITERNDKLLKLTYSAYDITNNIKSSFTKFKDVFDISKELGKISASGKEIIISIMDEMKKIANSANATTNVIIKLNKAIGGITSFVADIDEIADTTNVLAINAGIQASRAGSYGAAFAVIVDEIRKLSANTTQTTKNISESAEEIKQLTQKIEKSMDIEHNEIKSGERKVSRGVESIKNIESKINNMLDMMEEIKQLNDTQNKSAEAMMNEVEKIDLFQIADND